MYYLNDKHSKYEYAIYCRVGRAIPYIKIIFNSLDDVYRHIAQIEKKHNRYNQFFYIDNDFYKNIYNISCGGTYYKVLRRPVADWEEFETETVKYFNVVNFYR